jgi:hypothetical protein
MRDPRIVYVPALLTLVCLAVSAPALAQLGGGSSQQHSFIEIAVRPASVEDARLLAAMETAFAGSVTSFQNAAPGGGMGVVLRFPDAQSAARFFVELGRMKSVSGLLAETTLDVDLAHADPRSVRARLGAETLVRDSGVGVSCRLEPPRIRLSGEASAVEALAQRVRELDTPPAPEPGPEAIVRSYVEKWLIAAEDAPAPDVAGMYALTTAEARDQVGEAEFAVVLDQTSLRTNQEPAGDGGRARNNGGGNWGGGGWDGPGGNYAGGVANALAARSKGELIGVYPPRLSADGSSAVVAYSIAWTDLGFANGALPGGMMGPGMMGAGMANAQQQVTIAQPRAADSTPLRSFARLQRGEALVVREADGSWRLPMLFDAASRTWLPPLSPSLVRRLAPELAPLAKEPLPPGAGTQSRATESLAPTAVAHPDSDR